MQFFIVAGHETTALAISWALYLLANAPDYQERARAQVTAQLNGRVAGAEDLAAMPLVEQMLEEAMRLYPPVGLLARTVLKEDELCGRQMRPNDILFLPIWALHRHELLWERPGAFRSRPFRSGLGAQARQISISAVRRGPARLRGREFRHDAGPDHPCDLDPALSASGPATPAPHPVMTMTVRPEPGVFLELQPLE